MPACDTVFRNAASYDGTGAAPWSGDLALTEKGVAVQATDEARSWLNTLGAF